MDKENDLTQTKLHGGARLLEEGIDHRMVKITYMLIGMSVEMLTILEILCIQVLAREVMLELMEMQMIALISLLLPSLRWLQGSPKLMGCPYHLRCGN